VCIFNIIQGVIGQTEQEANIAAADHLSRSYEGKIKFVLNKKIGKVKY
jgi:hypothetical protein